jgi:hypothetical protein
MDRAPEEELAAALHNAAVCRSAMEDYERALAEVGEALPYTFEAVDRATGDDDVRFLALATLARAYGPQRPDVARRASARRRRTPSRGEQEPRRR